MQIKAKSPCDEMSLRRNVRDEMSATKCPCDEVSAIRNVYSRNRSFVHLLNLSRRKNDKWINQCMHPVINSALYMIRSMHTYLQTQLFPKLSGGIPGSEFKSNQEISYYISYTLGCVLVHHMSTLWQNIELVFPLNLSQRELSIQSVCPS